ncbi:MAG: sulfatase-like hydrolase/transferase [Solirubrobacterales bacterium]|nr:sulfatase-like hydrolase/transferase [Solirubrobacterales bacterium]
MGAPSGGSEARQGEKGLRAIFGRPAPTRRQLLLGGGHLAALWALAFVQPLLDLLGKNPDFFVARANTPGDILILSIGFTFLPPLALFLVEWLVSRFSARAYYGLHFVFLGAIATFFFIQVVSDLFSARTAIILLLSLALAALLAWSVFRFTFIRNLMDILIVAPLVILALFLFASDTTKVIFPGDSDFKVAADSGDDTPIVLMIFDELGTADLMTNDRQIDGQRFPNFARLAGSSTWYKNQSTTAFFTPHAVPGILTGISQPADTLPTSEAQPLSIFSQFSHDRPLHVLEPVTAICPNDLCPDPEADQSQSSRLKALYSDLKYVEGRLVLPPGIASKLPDVSSNFEGFGDGGDGGDGDGGQPTKLGKRKKKKGKLFVKGRAQSDPALYEQFIRQVPKSDRGLTVMHMHLPHQIWKLDTKGDQYNRTDLEQLSESTNNWMVNSNGISTAQARMYTQTGYADDLLGQMRRQLVKDGLWDKAIVIVTADHGISFEGDGVPQRRADDRAMGEVANPPLFIKYPHQKKGLVSPTHSMTLDIVPTIAKAVGVKDPYKTDGVPLQGPVPDRDVEITDSDGKVYTASVEDMIKQRNQAIARADQRLGTGPIYTMGAAPELIGRKVPPVPAGASGAQLDDPDLWKDYRPGKDLIPMFVTGTMDSAVPADPAAAPVIAIAVNGVIRGTGRPFAFAGKTHFGALVDPDSLRPGANRIGLYRVQGGNLVPIGGN